MTTRKTKLLYVAYPMRLDLGAANAIQTYNTVRELRALPPDTASYSEITLVIPRWLLEPSAFSDLEALHLPRPAVNKLSRFIPWAGWSYIERTLFSWMLVVLLLLWRITGHGYRILYVRDVVCAAWLAALRPIHGAKVIYEVHDLEKAHPSNVSRWPAPLWRRLLPMLDRAALGKANRLVSLTHAFRRWAAKNKIQPQNNITVIPDAFNPDLYYPRDKAASRAQLGISHDAFVVGYGGLTFAYRRLDLLVEAFALIRQDSLLLLVGGRPHEVAEMRDLVKQKGIENRVITPGQVSQEQNALYMSAADVLVIPDTVTGITASPLKLFEYMALARPIVLREMPALREIVDDTSALFFPAGDAQALADALAALDRDPSFATRLSNAAHQRSLGYTYKARAQKIAEVVQECS